MNSNSSSLLHFGDKIRRVLLRRRAAIVESSEVYRGLEGIFTTLVVERVCTHDGAYELVRVHLHSLNDCTDWTRLHSFKKRRQARDLWDG